MLVKNGKISKKRDFDNIFKKGKSASGAFLILKFIKNNLEINRFAFIVSKKVSPKAVVRNKIRRRLSETTKKFKNGATGLDIIFLVLPTAREKSFLETKEEAIKLLNKIGLTE